MKALVVDDSLTIRRIVIKALGMVGISDAVEAGDGAEASSARRDRFPWKLRSAPIEDTRHEGSRRGRFTHDPSTTRAFLGVEVTDMSDEVIDAISELANMVAGAAKAKFNQDRPLELTLPTVVEGAEYRLRHPTKSVWLEVPFVSEAGPFSMEVTFSSN